MKKNDDIKLDVTSNIDEKIIDEVTDKKISLLQKSGGTAKNLRKRFIAIGSIAASFVLMFSVLLVIIIPLLGSDVPVYQGMTIRQESTSSMEVQKNCFSANGITLLSSSSGNNGFTFLSSSNGNYGFTFLSSSNGNGNAYGHDKDNHKKEDDQPKNDIEDIVVIDVKTDDEVRYYVKPGETFIIEIHIDNPRDYEIQSFTLNGKKYANYMFKEGSTMELLLLEVTAPETPGYVEYTIDAIKYIDGTEIKDVDMSSGDKSVKAGIAYPTTPSASVTSQSILPTSIEFSVNITDPYKLIGQNELSIYLSDGESIISSKPLSIGENNITFDNLTMNKTYEYGVVTSFDSVDGKGMHEEWLVTNTITTAGAFGINNATATQDSISFEIEKIGEVGDITSVSLFDAETDGHVASGGADIREFTGLLSNHTYNLYVDFKYTANGEEISDWVAIKGIKTGAKNEPTVSFGNIASTDSAVSGVLNMTDPDGIGAVGSVDLYKNGTLVKNNAEKKINFTELDSYTAYQIVVTYTFDLNDGAGVQTKTATYDFTTSPYLAFNSCNVMNTSTVSEGGTIFLRINITNPNKVVYQKIVVNGKEYDVVKNSSTETMLYCEIVNNGQFEGGETGLTVEKVTAELGGKTYTIEPYENNTASVFVYGRFDVERLSAVVLENGEYKEPDYIFPGDKLYLMITLYNKTGYSIDDVTILGNDDSGRTFQVPAGSNLTRLDDEHYIIPIPAWETGWQGFQLTNAKYSLADLEKVITPSNINCSVLKLDSNEIRYISTPEDLLNMHDGAKYYELQNDIDLSGLEWRGGEFSGVLEGNGHSIKNMSFVGTLSNTSADLGLFTSSTGVIKNLNIEGANFVAKQEFSEPAFGCISARIHGELILENCSVDSTSFINVDGNSIGGMIGETNGSVTVRNCTNHASISGNSYVGGIIGNVNGGGTSFINCRNYGAVSGSGSNVGGIVGQVGDAAFEGCANYAAVSGGDICVGGIAGDVSGSTFEACVNYATISSGSWTVGGIVGGGGDSTFKACANFALIKGSANYGGIAGSGRDGGTFTNCLNTGYIEDSIRVEFGIVCNQDIKVLINCYTIGDGKTTADRLNSKSFYLETLGWSEDVWNLDDLDVENGKYPTLK